MNHSQVYESSINVKYNHYKTTYMVVSSIQQESIQQRQQSLYSFNGQCVIKVSEPFLPWQTLPGTPAHTSTWREGREMVPSCQSIFGTSTSGDKGLRPQQRPLAVEGWPAQAHTESDALLWRPSFGSF